MQTSGNGSNISPPAGGRASRAAGVGLLAAVGILVSAMWTSCSPGAINCDDFPEACGAPGTGGMGGAGPMGGMGGAGGSVAAPAPAACNSLQVKTLDEMETKFLMQRCGTGPGAPAICHTTFPPTDLSKAGMRAKLLNRRGALCPDNYLNSADPARSFLLAKVNSATPMVNCPSGGMPGAGGMKMPNAPAMPLSADELACFTWYVTQASKP